MTPSDVQFDDLGPRCGMNLQITYHRVVGQNQLPVAGTPDIHLDHVHEVGSSQESRESVVRIAGRPPPVAYDEDMFIHGPN